MIKPKEKEYFLPLPRMEILQNYISRQEDKTYPVNRESMIKYEGKKYSIPTRYIGKRMTVKVDVNGILGIYYNNELFVCHELSKNITTQLILHVKS